MSLHSHSRGSSARSSRKSLQSAQHTASNKSLLSHSESSSFGDVCTRLYAMLCSDSAVDVVIPNTTVYRYVDGQPVLHTYMLYSSKKRCIIQSAKYTTFTDCLQHLVDAASNDVYNVTQYVATVFDDNVAENLTAEQLRDYVHNKAATVQYLCMQQYVHCNTINSHIAVQYHADGVPQVTVLYSNTTTDTAVKASHVAQCQSILQALLQYYAAVYRIHCTELSFTVIVGCDHTLYLSTVQHAVFDSSIQTLAQSMSQQSLHATRSDVTAAQPSATTDAGSAHWQSAILAAQQEIVQLDDETEAMQQAHTQQVDAIQLDIDTVQQQLAVLHNTVAADTTLQQLNALQSTHQQQAQTIEQLRNAIDERQQTNSLVTQQQQQIEQLSQQLLALQQQRAEVQQQYNAAQDISHKQQAEQEKVNKLNDELLAKIETERTFVQYIKQQIAYHSSADKHKLIEPTVNSAYTARLSLLKTTT